MHIVNKSKLTNQKLLLPAETTVLLNVTFEMSVFCKPIGLQCSILIPPESRSTKKQVNLFSIKPTLLIDSVAAKTKKMFAILPFITQFLTPLITWKNNNADKEATWIYIILCKKTTYII